jgi:Queuine tRNA-ribosyltransferase
MILTLLRCAMLISCATAYGWRRTRVTSAVRTAFKTKTLISSSALRTLPENRDDLNVVTAENVPYDNFKFELVKQSDTSRARLGTVTTPHGIISTPNFVFCATKAAMKAITPAQLWEAGSQIILSNTYHLMLTPGPEIIDQMGGLQKFTNWRGIGAKLC